MRPAWGRQTVVAAALRALILRYDWAVLGGGAKGELAPRALAWCLGPVQPRAGSMVASCCFLGVETHTHTYTHMKTVCVTESM